MADFSEKLIQSTIKSLKEDCGFSAATREFAILELEDMQRKGCLLERADGYCIGCSATANGGECPMNGWEKRHPEYANDELAMKIKVLEAGGEEAYKEKMKRQEELLKKAEEEKNRAKDEDRIDAACKVLQIVKDSSIEHPVSAIMISAVVDLIRNAKTTKSELEAAVAKFK